MRSTTHDVAIVGAGVTGMALLHVLSRYSTVRHLALFEACASVAEVNSHPLNNAQTSHDGGTETNYNLAHALDVKRAAIALRRYVDAKQVDGLARKTTRMVLAVGAAEVAVLEERFRTFSTHYPDLRLVYANELREIEPAVMEGRDPEESVCALVSNEGYAINYQMLAQCFMHDVVADGRRVDSHFRTKIVTVIDRDYFYELVDQHGRIHTARVVVFAAGAYSLHFAHQLGYGKDYAILSIAGSFYSAGDKLRGKVYRVQQEGLPFAAIHGDPDVLNSHDTRFGPTTKPIPLMMRHRYETFLDFMRMGLVSLRGIVSIMRILARKGLVRYLLTNVLYDLLYVGKRLFLREARKIVPTLTADDLRLRKHAGGVRPQLVNLATGELEMGDKTLIGGRAIFNTTPSPGASVCLANAVRDARQVVAFLGDAVRLDERAIERDLGLGQALEEAA